jgi:GNAT superfamily N-acetyltransferase
VTARTAVAPRAARGISLRPTTRDDVGRCRDVFFASVDELHDRLGQPQMPRNPAGLERQYEHLLTTDPGHAWLAEHAGAVVGFGMANRRGRDWLLSFLFVLREYQGAGLGRRILMRCLPDEAARGWVPPADGNGRSADTAPALATCAESFQPVSTALYARWGMLPRLPIYLMVGRPRPGALPALPSDVTAVPFEGSDGPGSTITDGTAPGEGRRPVGLEAVSRIDRELLAYARPADHRWWQDQGRQGILFVRAGEAVGYGYARSGGRIGPVGVRHPAVMPYVLGHLVALADPEGACQVVVPGTCGSALVPLLDAGLHIDGAPAIYCATSPGPHFERYLPNSFALL